MEADVGHLCDRNKVILNTFCVYVNKSSSPLLPPILHCPPATSLILHHSILDTHPFPIPKVRLRPAVVNRFLLPSIARNWSNTSEHLIITIFSVLSVWTHLSPGWELFSPGSGLSPHSGQIGGCPNMFQTRLESFTQNIVPSSRRLQPRLIEPWSVHPRHP